VNYMLIFSCVARGGEGQNDAICQLAMTNANYYQVETRKCQRRVTGRTRRCTNGHTLQSLFSLCSQLHGSKPSWNESFVDLEKRVSDKGWGEIQTDLVTLLVARASKQDDVRMLEGGRKEGKEATRDCIGSGALNRKDLTWTSL